MNKALRAERTTFVLPSPAFIVDLAGTNQNWRADGPQSLMDMERLRALPPATDDQVMEARRRAQPQRKQRRRPSRLRVLRRKSQPYVRAAALIACWSIVLLTLPVLASARSLPPADESQSLRIILADRTDRGAHPVGTPVTRKVTIENKREVPLALSVGKKSCGCTQASISHDRLDPGQRAEVTLVTTVQPVAGPQRQTAEIIVTPEGGQPEVFIADMQYQAGGDCTASSEPIRLWAVVGTSVHVPWWVTAAPNADPPAVFSAKLDASVPGRVDIQPIQAITPYAQEIRLTIEGKAPGYRGGITADVSSREAPTITVPVLVRIADAFRFEGGGVLITDAEPKGQKRAVPLWKREQARIPATLTVRVEPPDAGFQVSLESPDKAHPDRWLLHAGYDSLRRSAAAYAIIEGEGLVLARVPLAVVSLK